jgi:hypothetical protein
MMWVEKTGPESPRKIEKWRIVRFVPGDEEEGEAPPERPGIHAGKRTVTFPVPVEGEIYIRYGTPGGVSIRSGGATEEAMPPAPEAGEISPPPPGPAPFDEDALRAVIREELEAAGLLRPAPEAVVVEPKGEAPSPAAAPSARIVIAPRASSEEEGTKIHGFRPYTGFSLNEPTQWVIGGRFDLGPAHGVESLRVLPELGIGAGDDATSVLLGGNLHYEFPSLGSEKRWVPYAYGGLGVLVVNGDRDDESEFGVNLGYGIEARWRKLTGFAEHSGVNAFDWNRLLVGIRLNR